MLSRDYHMPPRELLTRFTHRELVELWVLYRVEPWGEFRADLRSGLLAAAQVNLWVKEGVRPRSAFDFVPKFWRRRKRQRPEDEEEALKRQLIAYTVAQGGTVITKE